MSFMQRSTRHFLIIKAARLFRQEIEKAGLDNLKTLADAGISITATYLDCCYPQGKEKLRRELNTLRQMGITLDMVLNELTRQNPELALILQGRESYKQGEIQKLEQVLAEG